ncbi:carbohydrate kinase family protein [Subtercola lobariae]|uniref:Sugar kinase n=1 Tax=Subtercola lobariae TaxID=1588641 RepID=A0A917B7U4_9MICO|nr:PfkB family carbohydrate kinase [Subtercola lobariae]GGF25126.1 sugar kinase [Subtercola lobariae]
MSSAPPADLHLPVRVVVFGDVFDDIIVKPTAPVRSDTDTLAGIERRPGGSAANTAAWLGALGTQVDFVGRTNLADTVRHETALRNSGVTPHLLGESTLPTGTIVVIVEGNTRTMLTERGANALTSPNDVSDALLQVATHLHFTGYTIFSGQPHGDFARLISRAHEHGVTVSVDPASSGFIADHGAQTFLDAVAGADILFPNRDEAMALTGLSDDAAMVDALTEHFAVVALTLGRSGALIGAGAPAGADPQTGARAQLGAGAQISADAPGATSATPGIRFAVPCQPVEPRDTTGAGDAFNAGFLAGLFEGSYAGERPFSRSASSALESRLQTAASRGVATAARAIENVGARPPGVVTHHHGLNAPGALH